MNTLLILNLKAFCYKYSCSLDYAKFLYEKSSLFKESIDCLINYQLKRAKKLMRFRRLK